MTKFITLTEIRGNDVIEPMLVNTAYIQHIQVSMKGKDVHIRMCDKSFFFVKESLDEIGRLIADGPKPAQPVMFNCAEEAERFDLAALQRLRLASA